jgi:hypothetical protein
MAVRFRTFGVPQFLDRKSQNSHVTISRYFWAAKDALAQDLRLSWLNVDCNSIQVTASRCEM